MRFIVKTLKSLFGNTHPRELAVACAFGVVLGFLPPNNLTWYLIFFITFFLKINIGTELLVMMGFRLLALALDPALHSLGLWVLNDLGLANALVGVHQVAILPLLRLNNTLVIGSLIVGALAFVPVMLLAWLLIKALRQKIVPAIVNSPLVKGIMKLPLFQTIAKLWRAGEGVL
jgi:uncharacterized protein (TIGR03546 family)